MPSVVPTRDSKEVNKPHQTQASMPGLFSCRPYGTWNTAGYPVNGYRLLLPHLHPHVVDDVHQDFDIACLEPPAEVARRGRVTGHGRAGISEGIG